MRAGIRVGQEGREHLLMIALERGIGGRKRIAGQAFEHAARVRPAVDIVAERDGERRRPAFGDVALDRGDCAAQQVDAAVDVADGVDALRLRIVDRHGGLRAGGLDRPALTAARLYRQHAFYEQGDVTGQRRAHGAIRLDDHEAAQPHAT